MQSSVTSKQILQFTYYEILDAKSSINDSTSRSDSVVSISNTMVARSILVTIVDNRKCSCSNMRHLFKHETLADKEMSTLHLHIFRKANSCSAAK